MCERDLAFGTVLNSEFYYFLMWPIGDQGEGEIEGGKGGVGQNRERKKGKGREGKGREGREGRGSKQEGGK